jgi:hypothetical protein
MRKEIGNDGVRSPWADALGAVRTGEFSQAGKEKLQVIGDFCDRTDGATGRPDGVGLAEGDGRGNAFNTVNSGAVHSLEELAGVRAESLGVTALAFGVKGVEGERGFS